mgnify:CR=1 FL=1
MPLLTTCQWLSRLIALRLLSTAWWPLLQDSWARANEKMVVELHHLDSINPCAVGEMFCFNGLYFLNGNDIWMSRCWLEISVIFSAGRMCENQLLHHDSLFPDSVFSGSGDSNNEYHDARITKGGWCPSVSSSVYLLIDLQKDYHVTQIVTLADKEQRMWSSSYSLKYSHNTSYENIVQVVFKKFQKYSEKLHE